ncbi:hypothetical protein [Streptomyces cinnamoneus]|uniref:ETS domain-containing protein n=1 Tax=Streptomyces cinnamoneus TaxID=53446 RepID=A0A918WJ61_STRCJ|nr:hypothetical protein [Streptomyces cinnamoneus]GHC50695.1 hypothetical protein GCM10010507_28180 [Streptomyces cinnamoneus]
MTGFADRSATVTPQGVTVENRFVEDDIRAALAVWERMVRRLASDRQPDGCHALEAYGVGLRARDELARLVAGLPQPAGGLLQEALDRLDDEFRKLTVHDDWFVVQNAFRLSLEGRAARGWWWRRKPPVLPWSRMARLLGTDFDGNPVEDPYDVIGDGLDDPRHRERVPGLVALVGDPAAADHERLTACIALLEWGEAAGYEAVVGAAADPGNVVWYECSIDRKFSVDNTFGQLARAMAFDSGLPGEKGTQAARTEAVRALVRIADGEYFDEQLEGVLESCVAEPGVIEDVEDVVRRGVRLLAGDARLRFDLATQLVDLACAVSTADVRRAIALASEVLAVAPGDRALEHARVIALRAEGSEGERFAGHLRNVGDALRFPAES